ncbi:MAG: F-type H+-transporting ATPase subunit b [Motiliproteus sp.]|jgi:F-type H+-transporting ATPase subunit b
MLIDWFTVIAQVINFLILVWLLKRFLYRPILDAIDARENRMTKELADANAKKTEAQKERDAFQHKNDTFEQQRAALLSKATAEAQDERQRLLDDARQAADTLREKRQETLRMDAHRLNLSLYHKTRQEVFAIARKALTDLAATSLEAPMVDLFRQRLGAMDDKIKAGLAETLKVVTEPVLVRSAFALSAEQQAAIQQTLNNTFSTEVQVRFETSPALVCGIEMTSNGYKVAWSIADYLASLEKSVAELLKEDAKHQLQNHTITKASLSEAKHR